MPRNQKYPQITVFALIFRRIVVSIIFLYQITLSPILRVVLGTKCRYDVSCSEYTKSKVLEKGFLVGIRMGFVRLLSCQPFGKILLDDKS